LLALLAFAALLFCFDRAGSYEPLSVSSVFPLPAFSDPAPAVVRKSERWFLSMTRR